MDYPDLNALKLPTDAAPIDQRDFSISSGTTSAYFKNLEAHLIRHIAHSDVVLGCVAWLTSEPILRALASKQVAIVVQKEDFLRPDAGAPDKNSPGGLRGLYERLRCDLDRYEFPGIMGDLSSCADPSVDPVRCVGNHNADRAPAFPRCHHKFAVFGKLNRVFKVEHEVECTRPTVEPYGVWTGSFNFTKSSVASFENAVYIGDSTIANAYAQEFAQLFALSEPLDWTTRWSAPEYRIGT